MTREQIQGLEQLVQRGLKPDLTLLFDVDVETGLARIKERGGTDRFESETVIFFEKVRSAYLEQASLEPERICVIDAGRELEVIQQEITSIFRDRHVC